MAPERTDAPCGRGGERVQISCNDVRAMRPPTSHERQWKQSWDASYTGGHAPWDIGEPQPAFLGLEYVGTVLDAGCGTGENALHVAALGHRVVGVDVAETAIAMAREKALERGLEADFRVQDALHLERLGERFDTVLDSGLFHTFDAQERREYVASLKSVTRGTLYVLCFREAPGAGPHPVSEAELRAAFADGWELASLLQTELRVRFDPGRVPAWLVTLLSVESG
jgi:SAM-dependent methyltransferase